MCPKISLKWDNFSSYLFPPTLSTDIAMQRCILGNIFDNHFVFYSATHSVPLPKAVEERLNSHK